MKFKGIVYVKPYGRGMTIIDPEKYEGQDLGIIFINEDSYYRVEMDVVEISADEALNNWEEPEEEEEKDPVSILFQQ